MNGVTNNHPVRIEMKIILRVLIALAVALLFASANASMGPAQEKVNSDVAKDLNAATQSDKIKRLFSIPSLLFHLARQILMSATI